MSDSLHRLAVHESESRRKDEVIASLRMELAAYKKNSRSKDIRSVIIIDLQVEQCDINIDVEYPLVYSTSQFCYSS